MLKSTILAAVETARQAAQDLVVEATLISRGVVTHVPGTAPTYPTVTATISVLPTKFEDDEIDGQRVKASDFKYLAFPKSGVKTPEPNDTLVIGGLTFRVIHNDRVMAGDSVALSQLQLRFV